MITCAVCGTENDEYATTCLKCRGFLQNRIPNLDLFETAWSIIESPRKAFQHITLAEHKNFSLFLFSLFGISLSFTGLWFFRLGDRFDNLLTLIIWGLLVGAALGVVLAPIISFVHLLGSKLFGGNSSFRNSLGVVAYSLIPIVFSLFFVLPIELLTFGMYLFTANPHPYTIKPVSYVILVGFDTAVGMWAIGLSILGTKVGQRLSLVRSAVLIVAILCLSGGCLYVAARSLLLRV